MYLSKELLLAAYADLATLTDEPTQQGTTQKVSAIRYFMAMDAFCKQTARNVCDTNKAEDRLKFCACVADIVGISDSLYTPAFYWPLKEHSGDCGTGSNFFSAGQVNYSRTGSNQSFPYPKRGGWPPLLIAKNGKVRVFSKRRKSVYQNINWYIGEERHRAAILIWIARNWGTFSGANELSAELKNEALNHYSNDLLEAIFPPESVFTDFLVNIHEKYALEQQQITSEDIKSLFLATYPHQQGQMNWDSYQLITYGAPGTGKSHRVDGLANNLDVASCVRTTFHPDSDYSTFVGAYKPVMNGEKIAYEFRPQAFMKAYVRAWQEMVNQENEKVKNVVLVIEEINRGNCAQIFGDLFQLLDRGNGGYSTYPIEADTDLATWLAKDDQLGNKLAALPKPEDIKRLDDWSDILSGKKLALPPNLYIWATMNTSDQSLFPIDSAFKRRWDWEYVPITKPDKSDDSNWKERKIEVGDSLFDWWDFLSAINGHIAKATESEDKQLGYFFVKADDATGCISAEQFANKVLFYLYGDVFKSYELPKKDCFQQADNTVLKFRDFFYSEKVEEGEGENRVTHKPGDVKLDVVAAFLRGLKWKEKGVKEEPKGGAADANPD